MEVRAKVRAGVSTKVRAEVSMEVRAKVSMEVSTEVRVEVSVLESRGKAAVLRPPPCVASAWG